MTAPVIRKLWRATRITVMAAVAIIALTLALELVRAYALFHRIHPVLAYVFLVFLVIATAWGAIWVGARWLQAQVLVPPEGPEDGARSHRDLVACNEYLAARMKSLARNRLFTAEQQKHLNQQAYEMAEVLAHHPLQDDLLRGRERAIADTIAPAQAILRGHAEALSRERMSKIVNDVIDPPFPSHLLLTTYGHQFVMLSRIVDLYVPSSGLLTYYRVLRDVGRVIVGGRFLELGQTLFMGVQTNSPPLGRAAEHLGQALTAIWMTRAVSMASILRCEDLSSWSTPRAVAQLDALILVMLADSKDCLLKDVLPVLKQIIRHNVPPGVTDVTEFSSSVIDGLARAVDAAVKAHKTQPPATTIAAARRTLSGDAAILERDRAMGGHERRRRRRRNRSGVLRVLHVFAQRVKYTLKRPS